MIQKFYTANLVRAVSFEFLQMRVASRPRVAAGFPDRGCC